MIPSTYISRSQEDKIEASLFSGKVVIITGPRRVGKTTMLKRIVEKAGRPFLYLNGEDQSTAELFERRTAENYRNVLADSDMLVIDEAQHVPEIGYIAKLLHDELPDKQVILSGSSSFEIVQKTGEPLTGRKITFELLPFAESELWGSSSPEKRTDLLRRRMVFGNYPEIYLMKSKDERVEYLRELRDSYLLKDVVKFENLRSAGKILNLLRLVALQVGSEVSYHELGRQLSMSKNTVEKYLDLLSKAYVLYKLEGFSRNLRKEITKSSRWYFFDNGIMNIVLNNLDDLSLRGDVGRLWENYIISERWKYLNISRQLARLHFWRTYDQQEIDLIEERGEVLSAYEMKWKSQKQNPPVAWLKSYPHSTYHVICPDNYHSFVGIG
ncbi:MAG: ATP-binding protein [Bacteroidota bacterium]